RFANGAKAGLVAVRAALAIARYADHDQPRIAPAQLGPAQTPTLQGAWPEVFEQDVGRLNQRPQQVLALSFTHVEGDRFLLSRQNRPIQAKSLIDAAPGAHWVAGAGRLDFDHLGTMVGEEMSTEWPGDQLTGLDD